MWCLLPWLWYYDCGGHANCLPDWFVFLQTTSFGQVGKMFVLGAKSTCRLYGVPTLVICWYSLHPHRPHVCAHRGFHHLHLLERDQCRHSIQSACTFRTHIVHMSAPGLASVEIKVPFYLCTCCPYWQKCFECTRCMYAVQLMIAHGIMQCHCYVESWCMSSFTRPCIGHRA